MVNHIVDEIKKCLDNECYIAALALALTLPDTCGKAEYPEEKSTKKRYIGWYEEYVGKYERVPKQHGEEMPYQSGEVIYQLRCCLLHQSTPNIDTDKIEEECCKVDHFSLIIDSPFHGGASSVFQWENCPPTRSLEVNIVSLCWRLAAAVKWFFRDFPEKFDFIRYELRDIRKEYNGLWEKDPSV